MECQTWEVLRHQPFQSLHCKGEGSEAKTKTEVTRPRSQDHGRQIPISGHFCLPVLRITASLSYIDTRTPAQVVLRDDEPI